MASVLFLCDKPNWAFHITASHLARRIKKHSFDIKFVGNQDSFDANAYDLIYVFWWGERYHRKFNAKKTRTVKEISSHRWESQAPWKVANPSEAAWCFLHDVTAAVATSTRLAAAFRDSGTAIFHYPLGVDPDIFRPESARTGEIVIGWAGNPGDPMKRYDSVFLPATSGMRNIAISPSSTPHHQMPPWYRSIDILCVTSIAEGTPLPLIEAMACGAFPVTTDVGVSRELIVHEQNGFIFDGTPEGLSRALLWCQHNADYVRKAGQENSDLIRSTRSWDQSATAFTNILDAILDNNALSDRAQIGTSAAAPLQNASTLRDGKGYSEHFNRINATAGLESAYIEACKYFFEDLAPLLPADRSSLILEIGTGHGHLLKYLANSGYKRLHGIDRSSELLSIVSQRLGDSAERLDVADAISFLEGSQCKYDVIIAFDVFEHFSVDDGLRFLKLAREKLRAEGRIILRTPNMANVLGGYSLYMDLTHRHGYTELTLTQLLQEAGFTAIHEHHPRRFWSRSRFFRSKLNELVHRFLYRINDRTRANWHGKNIVISAER